MSNLVFPDHTHLLFLLLFCFERYFVLSFSDTDQVDAIKAINPTKSDIYNRTSDN